MNNLSQTRFNTFSSKNIQMTLFAIGAALILALTMKPALAKAELDAMSIPTKVNSILFDTEDAIAALRIDPQLSLVMINQAIDAIKQLEQSYEQKVFTKTDDKHNTLVSKGYRHYYPPVGQEVLDNIGALPTLSYKINQDVLYKGSDEEKHLTNAYFDYTYAKASLMTAKDAINDNDQLEAMANLRRVFESVYLAPDFTVGKKG